MQFGQSPSTPPTSTMETALQWLVGVAWFAILGLFAWVAFGLVPKVKGLEDKAVAHSEKLSRVESQLATNPDDAGKPLTAEAVERMVNAKVETLLADRIRREVDAVLARRPAGPADPAPRPTVGPAASVPVGTVLAFAGEVIDDRMRSLLPDDWAPCDGRPMKSADHKALFAVLGGVYGDGSHDDLGRTVDKARGYDFNLPDYRAMFLRGVTGERKDEYTDLDIYLRTAPAGGKLGPSKVGSIQADAMKSHDHAKPGFSVVMLNTQKPPAAGGETFKLKNDPAGNLGPFTAFASVHNVGVADTRPRNSYVHYIIKVK